MIGIYKITNRKTGKFYVGRSRDVFERARTHFQSLKTGKHTNRKMQEEMVNYSLQDLTFEILENCSVSELKNREEFWIEELGAVKNGYNTIHKDEELFNNKSTIDSYIVPYLKKSFRNINPEIKDPTITIMHDDTFEFLLKLFSENMGLLRPTEEILLIPDKYKKYRNPPFVYLKGDFGL